MIFTDVLNQGLYFSASLFCGMVCGIYYDVFFAVRTLTKSGKIMTFIFDLLFFVLSIITFFYFLYIINGFDIKWFILMGFFGGFCIERYTCKKPVAYLIVKVYNGLVIIKRFLLRFKVFKKIL